MTSAVQRLLVRTAVGSLHFLTVIWTAPRRGVQAGLKTRYLLRSSRAGVVSADSMDIREKISQKRNQKVLQQSRPDPQPPSSRESAITAGRKVMRKQSVARRNRTWNPEMSAKNQELPRKLCCADSAKIPSVLM